MPAHRGAGIDRECAVAVPPGWSRPGPTADRSNPAGGQKITGRWSVTFSPQLFTPPSTGATPQPVPAYSGALVRFHLQLAGGSVPFGVAKVFQISWSRTPQCCPSK